VFVPRPIRTVVLFVRGVVDQIRDVLGGRNDAPGTLRHGDAGLRRARGQLRSVAGVGDGPGPLVVPAPTATPRTPATPIVAGRRQDHGHRDRRGRRGHGGHRAHRARRRPGRAWVGRSPRAPPRRPRPRPRSGPATPSARRPPRPSAWRTGTPGPAGTSRRPGT